MTAIRILGIAPYEGLHILMKNLARLRKDLCLTVYQADFMHGVEIVQKEDLTQYDAIISRGGTYDAIKKIASIPVFDIALSYYDILSAIKMAENYDGKIALVGFPRITNMAQMLCDILNYSIPVFSTNNGLEVEACIQDLKDQGYSMILGDNMANKCARKNGLHSILITSGSASITAAFDKAVEFCSYYHDIFMENRFYKTIHKLNQESCAVFSEDGTLLFTDLNRDKSQTLIGILKRLIPSVDRQGDQKVLRRISGNTILIHCKQFYRQKQKHFFFSINISERSETLENFGVQIKSRNNISSKFLYTFYSSNSVSAIRKDALSYSQFLSPVLILGEAGCGHDAFAEYLYIQSNQRESFLYIIDCSRLNQKNLSFLLNHTESPLYEKGHTFYFKNLQEAADEILMELLQFLNNVQLSSYNQLIFSIVANLNNAESFSVMEQTVNLLNCVQLNLPSLRERIHEIPTMITLYLNELAVQTNHQVVGIEPEGITYLQGCFWEDNIDGLTRIIKALVMKTETPYIKTEDVIAVLEQEKAVHPISAMSDAAINIHQPLNAIISDIILMLLKEEGMTQTKAAKELGICRTTLWKYIKH